MKLELGNDPTDSIKQVCQSIEEEILTKHEMSDPIERSGSCAIFCLIYQELIIISNIGDSRAIMSKNFGQKVLDLTRDHKPNNPKEKIRIEKAGGSIYQSKPRKNKSNKHYSSRLLPWRILPGRLSVSRTIGDVQYKRNNLGGKSGVLSSTPEIFHYKLSNQSDFMLICCDGIFDKLSSKKIISLIWEEINTKEFKTFEDAIQYFTQIVFLECMIRTSLDNLSIIFVAFKSLRLKIRILN